METTQMEQKQNNIKDVIEGAQQKYLEERIFRSRWKSIRASGIDDKCNRRLFYYLTCGELADEITTDLVSIFEEGKDQEPGVRRYLSELGFEIKKATFTENWAKYNISGQIDGILAHNETEYLVEIKTVSDFAWQSLQTVEDFLRNEKWYRKWYGQMQIYLLLFNQEKGLFILKRKQAKQIRILEIDLNYEYAEKLLQKAELVNQAFQENNPPPFLESNPIECKRCPFFQVVCNPILDFGEGTQNIEDTELETKLAHREEIKEVAKEYEKLDKEVKERFKEIPLAICGDFAISGKEQIRKYNAQEAKEIKSWVVTIEKLESKVG